MQERKIKEAEFFDQRQRDKQMLNKEAFEEKYSSEKFYKVIRRSHAYSGDWMLRNCKDKVVLDYCCGCGGVSLVIAHNGGIVHGIDISEESVMAAERNLSDAGFKERAFFRVMDAEKLEFPDNFFDAIVCNGVLHHLDLNYAFPELARVLKPTGSIIAIEALGYNPFFQIYRRFTPSLRTAYEAEHILTLKEVDLARKNFGKVNIRYFILGSWCKSMGEIMNWNQYNMASNQDNRVFKEAKKSV
jgi:SAM-dependent methyltransferase